MPSAPTGINIIQRILIIHTHLEEKVLLRRGSGNYQFLAVFVFLFFFSYFDIYNMYILHEDAFEKEVDLATFFDECHKTKDDVYVNALTEEKMVLLFCSGLTMHSLVLGRISAKYRGLVA